MSELQHILSKINKLTSSIAINYPEPCQFLEEKPITIPFHVRPYIDSRTLQEYLQHLKILLYHHLQTHKT